MPTRASRPASTAAVAGRRVARSDPALAEHVCLVLVCQGATHGWALGTLLASDGELGRIWSLNRSLTYRAVDGLVERRLVTRSGTAAGRGRDRTVLRPTPAGRRTAAAWLDQPVAHLRDVRTELLVKLQLRVRGGLPPEPLLEAQLDALGPTIDALLADDADDLVAQWRRESARAVRRFLRQALGLDPVDDVVVAHAAT